MFSSSTMAGGKRRASRALRMSCASFCSSLRFGSSNVLLCSRGHRPKARTWAIRSSARFCVLCSLSDWSLMAWSSCCVVFLRYGQFLRILSANAFSWRSSSFAGFVPLGSCRGYCVNARTAARISASFFGIGLRGAGAGAGTTLLLPKLRTSLSSSCTVGGRTPLLLLASCILSSAWPTVGRTSLSASCTAGGRTPLLLLACCILSSASLKAGACASLMRPRDLLREGSAWLELLALLPCGSVAFPCVLSSMTKCLGREGFEMFCCVAF